LEPYSVASATSVPSSAFDSVFLRVSVPLRKLLRNLLISFGRYSKG